MGRRGVAGIAATCVLLPAVLAGCEREEAACEAVTARLGDAEPAPSENRRFDVRGPGWIGGDSAYSVPLPDGRTAWLFSDSFVGSVNRWDVPRAGMRMIHNSLVVEDESGRLETHRSELFDEPHAFFPDASATEYYWVQDGLVEDGELRVFLSRTRKVGEHGFEWVGTAIGRVSLPGLEVVDITETPSAGGVAWGAAILEVGSTTYVYGVEDVAKGGKHLHLAKAPTGAVADRSRWAYLGADGWTDRDDASTRLTTGIANELSVSPFRDGYLMISQDTTGIYSPKINAWTACSPSGPWTNGAPVYTTPESGRGRHFTYNAHGHPELSAEGELLISYNVNTFDFAELTAHPTLYRPRFVTLDLD